MIFKAPPASDLPGGVKRLVDDLNRFHPPISLLPVFSNDVAAAAGNLKVGSGYVDTNGFVRRRMS